MSSPPQFCCPVVSCYLLNCKSLLWLDNSAHQIQKFFPFPLRKINKIPVLHFQLTTAFLCSVLYAEVNNAGIMRTEERIAGQQIFKCF